MTEKECLAAGIAVSLFAHFALLIAPRPPEPEPSSGAVPTTLPPLSSGSKTAELLFGQREGILVSI